jgi:hypothetical protein
MLVTFVERWCAEQLESRRLLSSGAGVVTYPTYAFQDAKNEFISAEIADSRQVTPLGTITPMGLTPAQVRHAYGFDQISFGGVAGDGSGQTIAIAVAFDTPGFVSTGNPNFASSDLHQFDQQFGIPDPPSFTKIDQFGGTNYPAVDHTWAAETSMDVEWIHAMAPGAKLVLVEANSAYNGDITTAAEMARRYPGVSVMSMSWSWPQNGDDASWANIFSTLPNHTGQTFVASSGDGGAPGTSPAASARVVGVGGTEFTLGNNSSYGSETGWSGSGGGIATYEPKPGYQSSVTQSSTKRTLPDVAFASTGPAGPSVYDSENDAAEPWISLGGTSFSVLGWSALLGIVNQGRTIAGAGTLDGAAQTLPGIYSLSQSDFHDITTGNNGFSASTGYDLVTGRGTPFANLVASGLVNYSRGQISGNVFKDTSLDGSLNAIEPVVANQTVFIDTNGNNTFDTGERSTKTDAWGNYAFHNLSAGSYTLVTIPPSGYSFSGSGQRQTISLASNANRAGVDFSFIKTGTASLSGTVYNDTNGNGVRDTGESGKSGVRIYFEVNNNGYADSFEQSVVTDANGNYTFANLAGGVSYTPRMARLSGYLDTTGVTSVTPPDGEHVTGHDFGLTTHPFISGNVFRDTDGDGVWDYNDVTESGWTIYLDSNNNGALDAGEPFNVTDSGGGYQIGGLGFGTFIVREVARSGYTQTRPANGSYSVTFNNLAFANSKDFGNKPATATGSIAGIVYNDLNGNGLLDIGETGISGITVYSDANNNSKLDSGEPSNVTNGSGAYKISGLGAGTYKIREILQAGWIQTSPANNYGHNVTLSTGQTQTGWKFGTKQITFGGSISGTVFNDANADLTRDNSEAGIGGITIYNDANNNSKLDTGELTTTTDANGLYKLSNLAAGSYKVREILQNGWSQTTPTNNYGWTITLAANQNLSAKDFGTKQNVTGGSISGTVFNDANGDRVRNNGEAGIGAITIYNDANNNSKLDAGEKTTLTDASGHYSLSSLAAGPYKIREVLKTGWTQTTPTNNYGWTITLAMNQSVSAKDFGTKASIAAASLSGYTFNDNNLQPAARNLRS